MNMPTDDRGPPAHGYGDDDDDAWLARRAALHSEQDRADAIAFALAGVSRARTFPGTIAAAREVLDRYLRIEAYAVLADSSRPGRIVLSRGLSHSELAALIGEAWRLVEAPIVCCRLGTNEWSLGWLAIYRVSPEKNELDPFDFELLSALRDEVGHSLRLGDRLDESPTVRPPSMVRLKRRD